MDDGHASDDDSNSSGEENVDIGLDCFDEDEDVDDHQDEVASSKEEDVNVIVDEADDPDEEEDDEDGVYEEVNMDDCVADGMSG